MWCSDDMDSIAKENDINYTHNNVWHHMLQGLYLPYNIAIVGVNVNIINIKDLLVNYIYINKMQIRE